MHRSLDQFVRRLEAEGELARVPARVSPMLEIAEIADRESKSTAPNPPSASAQRNDPRFFHLGGRALLFENVEGADHPVLINALGSYRRLELALGCHEGGRYRRGGFDAIGDRIGALVKPEPPRGLGEAVEKARQFLPVLRIGPKRARRTACQQVTLTGEEIDLRRLPIIKCWPLDGDLDAVGYPAGVNEGIEGLDLIRDPEFAGRYVTFAGIHTIHADDLGVAKPSSHNIGMYRLQLIGRRRLGMHWHVHHDGARHWRSWKKRGQRMPVAIVLGGESVLPFASIAPLPPGISELLFAGFLNGGGIPLTPCKTVPLRVPANAEMVIEGFVSEEAGWPGYDPREGEPLGPGAFFEGPFGDHTGFYSLPDRYPIVEVTAITMRREAVYSTTIVGLPPQEDYYLGKATERIFLPLLKTLIPDIIDYDLPLFGAFHNCAALQIHKEYPLQARRVMHSVWGAGQMAWTKTLFVVDDDVDVHDLRAVLAAASAHCDPGRDMEFTQGPLDILDHASPYFGAGGKMGFDCTRKVSGEACGGRLIEHDPPARAPSERMVQAALEATRRIEGVLDARLEAFAGGGWLLARVETGRESDGPAIAQSILAACEHVEQERGEPAPRFVILLGADVDIADLDAALFHWVANSDPQRDAHRRGGSGASGGAMNDVRIGRVGFDATPKNPSMGARRGYPVRDWPPVIGMDEQTKRRVSERWSGYGLA